MLPDQDKPRPRDVSPDRLHARETRDAVAGIAARMEAWQGRARILEALVLRPASDRGPILAEAKALRGSIVEARTDIIMILADASAGVAGNSRVVDVEKALDTLDETLKQIERHCR